jgi:hypothetical protein
MYRTVISVCEGADQTLSQLPAFQRGIATLKSYVEQIEQLEQIQVSPTKGITLQKEKLKDDVENLVLEVAGAIHAYAAERDNFELMKKTDFNSSIGLVQSELLSASERVQSEAEKIVAELADYGVTAIEVQQLKSLTDQLSKDMTKPKEARIDRSGATANIDDTFRSADALLKNQLDKLALKFRKTAQDFYRAYKSARNIEDRKGRGSNGDDNLPSGDINS